MHGQKTESKCLEFGVFLPRLDSRIIPNADTLQRPKNAFSRFPDFFPTPLFFPFRRISSMLFFLPPTYTLFI